MPTNSRVVAYHVILDVLVDGAYVNLALPSVLVEAELSGRDAAFATELTYGAVRLSGQYDYIIEEVAGRHIADIDLPVRAGLWLGAHQLLSMRVSAHAAVSETVELIKKETNLGAAKFANAVLRKISAKSLAEWLEIIAPGTGMDDVAIRNAHPRWIVAELDAALATDNKEHDLADLLAAHNESPTVQLVCRPFIADRAAVAMETGASFSKLSPIGLDMSKGNPGKVEAIRQAEVAVQDEGSQLAALVACYVGEDLTVSGNKSELMTPVRSRAGEKWLDMCAGPGGKAAVIGAIAANEGAHLTALELHPHRAKLVRSALRALPKASYDVHTADAIKWSETEKYDRIILDAPCSGLGALRRRPDARWRKFADELPELISLQQGLILNALEMLKPEGILTYITCSPVLAETREQLDAIAKQANTITLDVRPTLAALTSKNDIWGENAAVQLWTHEHGTDSMFIASFRKGR